MSELTAQPATALNDALEALRAKRSADAAYILGRVLALAPHNATALRLLGLAHLQRGEYAAAASKLRDALCARPDDAVILNDLGSALRPAGDSAGAIAALRRACELAPEFAIAWHNLGTALRADAQPQAARAAFERALTCDPGLAQARGALGDVLNSLGDSAGAQASYRAILTQRAHAPQAWFHLANLKTVHLDAADTAALQTLHDDAGLSDKDRIYVGFALAKALDDRAAHDAAFGMLAQANRLKRRHVAWDAEALRTRIDAIAAAFMAPHTQATDAQLGREVIFVVSMPRAASTLTEQILAAHPQVEAGNELPDLKNVIADESLRRGREFPHWVAHATRADWQRMGEDYLARTARWRATRPRFTDKGLENWQYAGAAAAMLPGARFVNCRRDALETCLSCYRQLFAFGNCFSYDLAELGSFWRDYDRLSTQWLAQLPQRWFEQVYEDLLAAPSAQVRRLLQFLDLPFDAACLDFHRSTRHVATFSSAQVRQPLARDTARAHLYGAALDPLRRALGMPQNA